MNFGVQCYQQLATVALGWRHLYITGRTMQCARLQRTEKFLQHNVLQATGNLPSFEQLFSKQTYVSLLPSVFSSLIQSIVIICSIPHAKNQLDPFRSLAKTHEHQKETDTYMQAVTLWEICHSTYLSIYASCVQETCSNFPSIVLQYVKFHACFLWNVKFLCQEVCYIMLHRQCPLQLDSKHI